jgi:small-conductance mechanosensitive channel
MMDWLEEVGLSLVLALVVVLFVWQLNRRLVKAFGTAAHRRIGPQVAMLGATVGGILFLILTIPVAQGLRAQLLSLFGIALTAVIALSSTTFVANAMGGLMLRAVRNFRIGDYVQVGEEFGRVSELGLFHVEIQTARRDLTTLPNMYLISNPVTVVRSSGTVITCDVSLGFDVKHTIAEEALLRGARDARLKDPYVHVLELGDFSVTYRVAGFLEDVSTLLTSRSVLRAAVLDALHEDGIEIVSPSFMNQRRIDPSTAVMPKDSKPRWRAFGPDDPQVATAEKIAFDKADRAAEAEELEAEKRRLEEEIDSEADPYDPEEAAKLARLEEIEDTLSMPIDEDDDD